MTRLALLLIAIVRVAGVVAQNLFSLPSDDESNRPCLHPLCTLMTIHPQSPELLEGSAG